MQYVRNIDINRRLSCPEKIAGGLDIVEKIGLTLIGQIEIEILDDWDFGQSRDINFEFKDKIAGERYFNKYRKEYPHNQTVNGIVGSRDGYVNIYKTENETYKLHINY